jgi:cytochrome c oxidase subunit IV
MDHAASSSEITFAPTGASGTKHIWKVFWILLIITVIELGLGLAIYAFMSDTAFAKILVKGVIVILSLAKAFYITASFMHLGDEIKNMIMTIVAPLMLFIWFIFAFLFEGNSWRNMRNTNAGATKYQKKIQQTQPTTQPNDAVKPGQEK